MVKLKDNATGLGKALDSNEPQMNSEQEIAFHQGCLNTLVNERNELIKMIGNVEAIMQGHLKRLEELGVKIQKK
tara:strand:+ start:296 stop:517 length:222 start_codon:yes stop_codon:yes gene_type:complete